MSSEQRKTPNNQEHTDVLQLDAKTRFERHWPLLLQGFSFPLYDQYDQGPDDWTLVLKPQSGSPPVFLFGIWLYFWCVIICIPYCILFYVFGIASPYFAILAMYMKLPRCIEKDITLDPQLGILENFQMQSIVKNMKDFDPFLKQSILLINTLISIRDSKSKLGVMSAITQYVQACCQYSLITQLAIWFVRSDVHEHADTILGDAFNIEAGTVKLDAQDGDASFMSLDDLPDLVDSLFDNFENIKNSGQFERVTKFLNLLVCIGFCSKENLTFSYGKMEFFSPLVKEEQVKASDCITICYQTLRGFVYGGWRVFKTGQALEFFKEEADMSEFEKMFEVLRKNQAFAIAGNLRKYCNTDENQYEKDLEDAIKLGQKIVNKLSKKKSTFEKKFISDRLDKLHTWASEFAQTRLEGGLRIQPFACSFFGVPGCGKSSLTELLINSVLKFNGKDASKDRIATWAENDKFGSTIRSHVNAIIFDDFANTKTNMLDYSPGYRLIQVINNTKSPVPMAEAHLKGKVTFNPYVCVVSTNKRDLAASEFSNDPASLLRRMYHVTVRPKREFCTCGRLDSRKVIARFGKTPKPDVWNLTVNEFVQPEKADNDIFRKASYDQNNDFVPVTFEGEVLADISISQFLRWAQYTSKEHFAFQEEFISTQGAEPELCKICGECYCDKHVVPKTTDDESEDSIVLKSEAGLWPTWKDKMNTFYYNTLDLIDGLRDNFRYTYVARMDNWIRNVRVSLIARYNVHRTDYLVALDTYADWWWNYDFIPDCLVTNHFVVGFVSKFIGLSQNTLRYLHGILTLAIICSGYVRSINPYYTLFMVVFGNYFFHCAYFRVLHAITRKLLVDRKNVLNSYIQNVRMKYVLYGFVAFVGTYKIVRYLKRYLRTRFEVDSVIDEEYRKPTDLTPEAGLNPENASDVAKRDAADNPWLNVEAEPFPSTIASNTATVDQLTHALKTNLVGVCSHLMKTTHIFYVCSNFALIPKHFMDEHDDDFIITVYRNGKNSVGSSFKDRISKSFSVHIPTTDFCLVWVTNGGAMKDVRKFLVTELKVPQTPAQLLTRDIEGKEYAVHKTVFKGTKIIRHTHMEFIGGLYSLPVETKGGMCMSPLISDNRSASIIGFHLGGMGRIAGCGIISQKQVNDAVLKLSKIDGVVLTASNGMMPHMGTFVNSSFGKTIVPDTSVHYKSPANYLTEGSNIQVFGSMPEMSSPGSKVRETIISNDVEEVFGVPQQWGAPKMTGHGVYPYQASLVHSASPSLPVGSVLKKAVSCYKSIKDEVKTRTPELFQCKPLTQVETVSGRKGIKFIDPMNLNTSPGFPFSGSKRPYIIDLNPDDYPEVGCPRTFTEEIWNEVEVCKEKLRKGERCYAIWKACLKDEPTKLTKDKVRVFQSAPLVIQILIRMYFLPIVRIIQMNPLAFECAVGVNAEGLEWEELWNHAMSKGEDRVLAGDYSKYDLRMPASVIIAAFDCLIDIARSCDGYTEDDFVLMESMVAEVIYPFLKYKGTLIQLFGGNPSGQNLTVIINSVVNSLLLRSCFYTMYYSQFKDACSFITYGDDVMGTVDSKYSKFNHIAYAEWLETLDMKFTMPDKESTPIPYMDAKDVDFLKRKCIYNKDLQARVGILSEDSIFKRLHSHLISKELTPKMHAANNIDSSLHDWFYYGREVFEKRRAQLLEVARRQGIAEYCTCFERSYDERVSIWLEKYKGIPRDEKEVVLT